MVVLLSRRIKSLQAFSDDADIGCGVIFGEGAVIYFCLLCFHFGELAELSGVAGAAGGLGVSSFSGGGGKSFVCPLFCERVGFYGIPDGFRFRAAVGSVASVCSSGRRPFGRRRWIVLPLYYCTGRRPMFFQ